MAIWLQSGTLHFGLEDGIVRRDDFAELVQACELGARAGQLLADAHAHAAGIAAAATERANLTIAEAETQAETLRVQACEAGKRDAAEQWAETMSTRAIQSHASVQKAKDRLAELVCLAAQRVVEVEDRQALYRRALRTVSQMVSDSKTLVLHIGTQDETYAREVVAAIAAEVGIEVPLEVRVDHRLVAGGCVLESDYGVVDASLGLQLDAVRRAIGKAARAALGRGEQEASPALAPPQDHVEDRGQSEHFDGL